MSSPPVRIVAMAPSVSCSTPPPSLCPHAPCPGLGEDSRPGGKGRRHPTCRDSAGRTPAERISRPLCTMARAAAPTSPQAGRLGPPRGAAREPGRSSQALPGLGPSAMLAESAPAPAPWGPWAGVPVGGLYGQALLGRLWGGRKRARAEDRRAAVARAADRRAADAWPADARAADMRMAEAGSGSRAPRGCLGAAPAGSPGRRGPIPLGAPPWPPPPPPPWLAATGQAVGSLC